MATDPTNVDRTMLINAPVHVIWRSMEDQLRNFYGRNTFMHGEWKKDEDISWYERTDEQERLIAKGHVLEMLPERRLRYTHFSTATGLPDLPENHTTVDITLDEESDGRVRLTLWQGEFAGLPDAARLASAEGRKWVEVLVDLRTLCEELSATLAA